MTVALGTFLPEDFFEKTDSLRSPETTSHKQPHHPTTSSLKPLSGLKSNQNKYLLANYSTLERHYSLLNTEFFSKVNRLRKSNQDLTEAQLKELSQDLIALRDLAIYLEFCHTQGLNAKRQANTYFDDASFFQLLLQTLSTSGKEKTSIIKELDHERYLNSYVLSTTMIRTLTGQSNWYRLFVIRLKRVCEAVIPMLDKLVQNNKAVAQYCHLVTGFKLFINPFLAYLSWLFYLPRWFSNLALLFKHLVPGPWMSDKEKQSGVWLRFKQQMAKKWFELANDTTWIVGGLLSCFLFVGALATVGSYVTLVLYGLDCVFMVIRCSLEWWKFKQQRKQLELEINALEAKFLSCADKESEEAVQLKAKLDGLKAHHVHLCNQTTYQYKQMAISLATVFGLLMAVALTMPCFSAPIIPLIGASLVVAICLTTFIARKQLNKKNPAKKIGVKEGKSLLLMNSELHKKKRKETQPLLFFSPTNKNLKQKTPSIPVLIKS